jgi:hypothetical protein
MFFIESVVPPGLEKIRLVTQHFVLGYIHPAPPAREPAQNGRENKAASCWLLSEMEFF